MSVTPGNDGGGEEAEPDYRFTLANERTFLAWIRTALGLLAGSVAVVSFGPDLDAGFREGCAVALALLGAACAAGGLRRWLMVQSAMTRQGPLRRGLLPFVLAGGMVVVAAVVALAVVIDRS